VHYPWLRSQSSPRARTQGFVRVFILVLGAFLQSIRAASEPVVTTEPLVLITSPHGVTIQAELADTVPKRATGLMFREALPHKHGMLFLFTEEQEWSFWMKNTRIPLDIIWMDKTKQIVHVEQNVPICTRTDDSCPNYKPTRPALYVLEMAAGSAEVLNLHRGVRLKFDVIPARQ
jgi:uncharacterized membrane protein (UPF0127 family)